MDAVVMMNLGILLGLIPVGVFLTWGLLRLLDVSTKRKFKDSLSRMANDPMALSLYYSVRFASVVYLVAALTSRFV